MQAAKARAKDAGVDVKTDFEVGIPKQAISETLPDLLDTTLTVIGKSGVHGLNRAIGGINYRVCGSSVNHASSGCWWVA